MFKVLFLISSVLLSMCIGADKSVQNQRDIVKEIQNEGDALELGPP